MDDLNDALVSIGPISVSVDAEPDSFYFYAGGLYYDSDCLSGTHTHMHMHTRAHTPTHIHMHTLGP